MGIVSERWYDEAVVYCVDVDSFADSNGDGVGDLRGLIGRLDYVSRLGASCLWLNPIHPTPGRDDGYDVADYYAVDERLGSLGDFAELVHEAGNRGIRVIIDLVVNHTSDQHPWFQSACSSVDSPYRDWYVWSQTEPSDRYDGIVFPGEQVETWTYQRRAHAWYYHRFYDFQPDLNMANPDVVAEIKKIMGFWLQLGVAGFRIDAAPFVIEMTEPGNPDSPRDFALLTELRQYVSWHRGDALLLAEANVAADDLVAYVADDGHSANRLTMLFDFLLNDALVLALARRRAEPIVAALRTSPMLPAGAQWATFLRNHDEIDLSRLTSQQRTTVFDEFGPDRDMRIYGRGIRRRLAPMLGGNRKRLELAYSLQFTLRGTPVLRYGEEIGMGDDLSLPDRDAIRTPMQWSGAKNAGFTTADRPVRPVVTSKDFSYETVNVAVQRSDPASLLSWFERMISTLREAPEIGIGTCTALDREMAPGVLVHRADARTGSMLFVHNLDDSPAQIDLSDVCGPGDEPANVFGDQPYAEAGQLTRVDIDGYGYRWIRLCRNPVG
jgi:maltose alpha-D-glucosyltransferase / alpha-amylase